MRSPKDMSKIQIDITNACGNICSNCTRFCGHHKKTFFMDYDFFKKAVDSLDGFEGIVGMIGGEPTLHPEFEKFADYIRFKRVDEKITHAREPIEDMQSYIIDNLWHEDAKAGLWSSLNTGYYKYFETINDTFKTQLLNDHNNTCMHQALLMSRKELGIDDEEWIKKRDACWIQNTWSATITPKGAFFCEVAGALDMLFDGPGGWKVEKDWWRREPSEFGEQLNWCEMCSGCLDVPQRISNDGRDDVTPKIYERLLELESPKAKKGLCVVMKPEEYDKSQYHTFTGDNDYMELGNNQRTTKTNRNLYPKNFMLTDKKGTADALKKADDWILVSDDSKAIQDVKMRLSNLIINPGCLYICGEVVAFNVRARSIRDRLEEIANEGNNIWGYYPSDKIVSMKTLLKKELHPVFDSLAEEESIALYGAGRRGREAACWLMENGRLSQLKIWVDKKYDELGSLISSPNELIKVKPDICIIAIEAKDVYEEVKKNLIDMGISEESVKWLPYVYKCN